MRGEGGVGGKGGPSDHWSLPTKNLVFWGINIFIGRIIDFVPSTIL